MAPINSIRACKKKQKELANKEWKINKKDDVKRILSFGSFKLYSYEGCAVFIKWWWTRSGTSTSDE
jgi:hypothetical protein